MSTDRMLAGAGPDGDGSGDGTGQRDSAAVLSAVREDVRQTLRTAWVDPAIDAAAAWPVFFPAAWSAIRPNVGKSFLAFAQTLRGEAAEAIWSTGAAPDFRKLLEPRLAEEEIRRIEESSKAVHLVTAKVFIVAHALARAAMRERIPGTGREEAPVRRGIPDWQRWMGFRPCPPEARVILDEAARDLKLPAAPSALRLFARWPVALRELWDSVRPQLGSEAWTQATGRLRRIMINGIGGMPHPVELQWTALQERGFSEEERGALSAALSRHEAGLPGQLMVAAFAWTAMGSPEIGGEH
jgi:hypothetical protein